MAEIICILFSQPGFAQISSSQSYTLVIPEITKVELKSSSNSFGEIQTSEFGTSNTSAHVISLGDGSEESSFVQSNNPNKTGNKKFSLSFSSSDSQVSVVQQNDIIKLNLNKNNETSVDILLTDHSQNSAPKLGSNGTPFVLENTNSLSIPPLSGVEFQNGFASMNMKMDLDESSLNFNTKPNSLSFDVVLSIVETD